MDARNQRMFNVIIFCSLILILGVTILTNLHYWWKLIPLSLLLLLSFLLRRKPILRKTTPGHWPVVLVLISCFCT